MLLISRHTVDSHARGEKHSLGFKTEINMSLADRQDRLQEFIDNKSLHHSGIKFYNVLYAIVDFEELPSKHEEFDTYNILVKRTHSRPYKMRQLQLATHKLIPACRSVGATTEAAVASAKRRFVSGLVGTLRWGLHSSQWSQNKFSDWTQGIDQYRVKGELPNGCDLDDRPEQEVHYVVPAYNNKILYISGVLRSNGTFLNWNKEETHDVGIYIGTSLKSLDAAIVDRQNKLGRYVAARLTAA